MNDKKHHSIVNKSKVELSMHDKIQSRFNKQYPLPPMDNFEHPWRMLHPHEQAQDGDEVWNL